MRIQLLCYGALRPVFGADRLDWDLRGETVDDLLNELARANPDFSAWRERVACALGADIVRGPHRLAANDELALLPPVGGG